MKKVIVIGCGMAGVAATHQLLEAGFTDVTILEALDRPGGRIHTIPHSSSFLELGAQWIHGDDKNPVYELAEAHSQVITDDDPVSSGQGGNSLDLMCSSEDPYSRFLLPDGTSVSETTVDESTMAFNDAYKKADLFFEGRGGPCSGRSAGSFIASELNRDRTDGDSGAIKGLFDWRFRMESIEEGCESLFDYSLSSYGAYVTLGADNHVRTTEGFRSVLGIMLDKIPNDLIFLSTVVKSVEFVRDFSDDDSDTVLRPGRPVVVRCENSIDFAADHVIVTSSLGYLKANADTMLKGSVSSKKFDSIRRMGFGTVGKVFLRYESAFWPPELEQYCLIWRENDKMDISDIMGEKEDTEWYRHVPAFNVVNEHRDSVLVAWIPPKIAPLVEKFTDSVVERVLTRLLRLFLPNNIIPEPIDIIRTYWYTNPYICGAYSYIHVGADIGDIHELARPEPSEENPVIQLSGEATHDCYFTTVHGAMLSGIRAANNIIHAYKKH